MIFHISFFLKLSRSTTCFSCRAFIALTTADLETSKTSTAVHIVVKSADGFQGSFRIPCFFKFDFTHSTTSPDNNVLVFIWLSIFVPLFVIVYSHGFLQIGIFQRLSNILNFFEKIFCSLSHKISTIIKSSLKLRKSPPNTRNFIHRLYRTGLFRIQPKANPVRFWQSKNFRSNLSHSV